MTTDTRFKAVNPWWVVMGIDRTSPYEIVKEVYYALSNIYHPDKLSGSLEIMQIINQSFEQAKKEKTESNGYANTQDSQGDSNNSSSSSKSSEPIDFRQYRSSDIPLITDSEMWDSNLEFPENWQNVLKEFIYLPNSEIQFPILSAIAMQPSAMVHSNLPIVFLSGNPGTGKTRILEMLSYPHRASIISGASTYASIRDRITINKFGNKAGCGRERNTALLFDNVLSDTLDDDKLYGLFLGAYDRNSSKIIISGGDDAPLEFDTFGLAVISSIVPIERDTRYLELQRRLLLLFTVGVTLGKEVEITSDYDFKPISELYSEFWNNPEILEYYVQVRKKVRPALKKDGRLSVLKYPLVLELIATGVACQIWKDIPTAIENFVRLIDLGKNYVRESPLELALREIINQHGKIYNDGNKSNKMLPKEIADELTNLLRERLIDSKDITPQEINRIMESHGYLLKNRKWELTN